MAAGDRIDGFGQYEFQQLVWNGVDFNTFGEPLLLMTKTDGLFGYDAKTNDFDDPTDDGEFVGEDHTQSRQMICEFSILGANRLEGAFMVDKIRQAWQPQLDTVPFVFLKEGITDRQMIYVRPRKLAIPTEPCNGMGEFHCVGELRAPDPRVYEAAWQLVEMFPDPEGNASDVCNMTGWYDRGSDPILQIDGPFTNPRITNVDYGRTIRLDGSLPFGFTLEINTRLKTVEYTDGASIFDGYGMVRNDNQWWSLKPGAQGIHFAATGASGSTKYRVRWQNARI